MSPPLRLTSFNGFSLNQFNDADGKYPEEEAEELSDEENMQKLAQLGVDKLTGNEHESHKNGPIDSVSYPMAPCPSR